MRIIKPGRDPRQEIECECWSCECVFVYNQEDINSMTQCNQICHYVVCPHCHSIIKVESWEKYCYKEK